MLTALRNILAQRWQIPLAFVAAAAFVVSLSVLRPPSIAADFDQHMADVMLLAQRGQYTSAADAASNLLNVEPALPEAQRAQLHHFLAELIYKRERQLRQRSQDNLKLLLEHRRAARELGWGDSAKTFLHEADARDWLGEDISAIHAYEAALEHDLAGPERRRALRELVVLLDGRAEREEQRRQYLYALLADEGVEPAYHWWALQRAVVEALDDGKAKLAAGLLDRFLAPLDHERTRGYAEWLRALLLVEQGRIDEAAAVLTWIETWLDQRPTPLNDLGEFTNLAALNAWLRGRLEQRDFRPQRALLAYDRALAAHPDDNLFIDTMVGRAQALATLQRHDAAQNAFRAAARRIVWSDGAQRRSAGRLMAALRTLFAERVDGPDVSAAAAYLSLALELTPEDHVADRLELNAALGDAYARIASEGGDRTVQNWRRAGQYFEQAATLSTLGADEQLDLQWRSGESYRQGGWLSDARRLYEAFLHRAATDPRSARAMLHVGETYERTGELEEAIAHYKRLIDAYPAVEEASRARLYVADSLVAKGADHYDEAARALQDILDGAYADPSAAVYRDAMLHYCHLLHQQGRFADAIRYLEMYRELYPVDAGGAPVVFLLADTFRRSAQELQVKVGGPVLAPEAVTRLEQAIDLYDHFLDLVQEAADQNATLSTYQRLAFFARGDCLFKLNQPETLREAIKTYQRAAVQYEMQPAALSAQVQIANCYLRLGEVWEAARAIERARWLLRNIPDAAFADLAEGGSRESWRTYLDAAAATHLFRTASGA